MIRYRVTHRTTYDYAETVPVCHNLVHLTPRSLPHQVVESSELLVEPKASHRSRRIDYFGNVTDYLGIEVPHRRLQITACSTIAVDPGKRVAARSDPPWEQVAAGLASDASPAWYEAAQFVLSSPRIVAIPEVVQYALP